MHFTVESRRRRRVAPPSRRPASNKPRFELGEVLITAKLDALIATADVEAALRRHMAGEWGLSSEDNTSMDRLLWRMDKRWSEGVMSQHYSPAGLRFWVYTVGRETTLLLPDEW